MDQGTGEVSFWNGRLNDGINLFVMSEANSAERLNSTI